MKNKIYYGEDECNIYTAEGKERLWREEKIIYIDGIYAFKILDRKNENPLIELWLEDDKTLHKTDQQFDSEWLKELKELIIYTEKQINI
jgi:hypothetical protein